MNFSIIIPNFNGAKFLPNCINSIQKAIDKCPKSKFEIILIDNNSTDNSVEIFKKYSDKFKILNSNYGFAKAINIGIKESQYEWIVVLNNDLELDKDWFKNITETQINPDIASICGSVLNNLTRQWC